MLQNYVQKQFAFDQHLTGLFNIAFFPFVFSKDPSLLNGKVTLHHAKAGAVLARQGEQVIATRHTEPLNEN